MLPAGSDPGDNANKPNDSDRSTGIIHRVLAHGIRTREVEGDGSEEQKQEPEDIQCN